MGIRRRILLSFLTLFLVVFIASAAIATFLIANAVEHRLQAQTQNLARLLSDHPEWYRGKLGFVERAYGASSAAVEPVGQHPPGEGVFRAAVSPGMELVMTYSPEVISREKSEAVRPFVWVAVGGVALVLVLGVLTAQTIARPLERLAEQAKALPSGDVARVGGGAELDHLVDAMNRMLSEVRRGERLAVMGRMAAGVAHEIRNPLSSMKMTVQMLREGSKDVEAHDRVLGEIERLELI